mmetsp:Transcript_87225/g.244783  ORF Transcript_87225/g.244783 Transcript_87225/m.244783 type:complete len:254 (+) Transcript_87225:242-1003(+)
MSSLSELPARSSATSVSGSASRTALAPASVRRDRASDSVSIALEGNFAARAFAPRSPMAQPSSPRNRRRPPRFAAARGSSSSRAAARSSAPASPMAGFPPRWEPNTRSCTSLRGKRFASASIPFRPMRFLSTSRRSSASQVGKASANAAMPGSPMLFELRFNSFRRGPAAFLARFATASAPMSPSWQSIKRMTDNLADQGLTKAQMTAAPWSPSGRLACKSSVQLRRRFPSSMRDTPSLAWGPTLGMASVGSR